MKTIVCVASGPSLTSSDCQIVSKSGAVIIAVNSSWEIIPECDHIYAGDFQWWQGNAERVPLRIHRWASSHSACTKYNASYFESPMNGSFNSGQRAILLAKHLGAERILLLGYDCSLTNGLHWHENHSNGLKNPDEKSIVRWKREFSELTQHIPAHTIINCSRHTELDMFERADLREQLNK